MKMVALLFGSICLGAAMVGFSNAGETIIVEPEPEQNAKACDQYGEGFVYLPGSETCVKISGEVRTTFTVGSKKTGG